MMHTIFQSAKKRPKITAEELEKQSSKVLPNREELVVMDYSTLNTPYYAAAYPQYPTYSNQQDFTSSYPYPANPYRMDYTPAQYHSTNYDWANHANYNYYTYDQYPRYDYDCNYKYGDGDNSWNNNWDNHRNDNVNIDKHEVDNWDNWRYSAYIYTNPHYDTTRLA